jgi:hypothetical protein
MFVCAHSHMCTYVSSYIHMHTHTDTTADFTLEAANVKLTAVTGISLKSSHTLCSFLRVYRAALDSAVTLSHISNICFSDLEVILHPYDLKKFPPLCH